jgi:hypothetical protein
MTIQPSSQAGPEKYFHEQLSKGLFQIQRCSDCEKAVFYPRMICPHCGSADLGWFQPSGLGTVYSTTVVRRKAEHGGDYNVALIDLHEGVRMMSLIEGIRPDQVSIGMTVKAAIVDTNDGKLVVFNKA